MAHGPDDAAETAKSEGGHRVPLGIRERRDLEEAAGHSGREFRKDLGQGEPVLLYGEESDSLRHILYVKGGEYSRSRSISTTRRRVSPSRSSTRRSSRPSTGLRTTRGHSGSGETARSSSTSKPVTSVMPAAGRTDERAVAGDAPGIAFNAQAVTVAARKPSRRHPGGPRRAVGRRAKRWTPAGAVAASAWPVGCRPSECGGRRTGRASCGRRRDWWRWSLAARLRLPTQLKDGM